MPCCDLFMNGRVILGLTYISYSLFATKYKARIRRGPVLEAAIGKVEAAKWGGKIVAIKIQRPGENKMLHVCIVRKTTS